MFLDTTGDAYALYSNGDSAAGRDVVISSINEDKTNLTEVIYTFPGWSQFSLYFTDKRRSCAHRSMPDFDLEAPTIIRTDKSYYLIASHKTGVSSLSLLSHPITDLPLQ